MKKKNKISKKNSHTFLFNPRTFGQRSADTLTRIAGSWTFIIILLSLIGAWVYVNVSAFVRHWDPWPFILLNLFLSCLAAIQAPIILMSQNRTGEKDRQRAEYDYAINRKAEREIQFIKSQLNRIEKRINKK